MVDCSSPTWRDIVARYATPDRRSAIIQLATTGLPYLVSMAALLYGLAHGFWLALLFALPAALFLDRLFIIQHDCGHGSFFRSRRANDRTGRIIGLLTTIPYTVWRKDHAVHHANTGNLDYRGIGDVATLTVREYLSRPVWRRLAYRVYRHPLILFGIGPAYLILIRYRVPSGNPMRDYASWLSIFSTNAAAALLVGATAMLVGLVIALLAWLVVLVLATTIGVWFFYIQHQFEDAYWEAGTRWGFHAAALEGSSYYDLPRVLHWLTGSIGFHHIHHLSRKIPNYRLRACFEESREFLRSKRLTLLDSLKCPSLALWDEERRKLIPFRQIHRNLRAGAAS